ncbi:MAG TPA: glycosyltransferase family A protein [Cyclobacteriaceae bacterium]|nr:glycosyltransferase family A protein [Cyclobacteriaceae bacterium]
MEINKKVSVIIPCYNQGQYLKETVKSVLNSTYDNLEIIVVDDGSTDNTPEVGKSLASEYHQIRYYHQVNSGPSTARNHGIRKATGNYILPLDADDLISSNYIEKAVNVLLQQPEVKVVYCEAEKFGGKNEPWQLKPFSLALLAKNNMIFVSAMYRKSDWESCGGYDENFIWGREDWEFWISMLKEGGEVVKLPIVGFYYRVSPHSRRKTMNNLKKKKLIAYINIKHRDFIHKMLKGPLRFQRSLSKPYNIILNAIGRNGSEPQ